MVLQQNCQSTFNNNEQLKGKMFCGKQPFVSIGCTVFQPFNISLVCQGRKQKKKYD